MFLRNFTFPELVGRQPTQKYFDSAKFFKEDLPLALPREGFGLIESTNFLYGKPPEKSSALMQNLRGSCLENFRKALKRLNMEYPKYSFSVKSTENNL